MEECEGNSLVELVEEAGLKYLMDNGKGFTRVENNKGFIYFDKKGIQITDLKIIQRITKLKIPPAWKDVWISPITKSHLQVTGKDVKGRKQYIYHQDWGKLRCETKFNRMQFFGNVLPLIRKDVEKDISIRALSKRKVIGTIIGLLDLTLIRIGNKAYAKDNNSFGLTTLKDGHVKSLGKDIVFDFVGKKGVKQYVKITDVRLANIVKKCKDIPGQELFQFLDETGHRHCIDSSDVNTYLRELTGEEITAKDFRTWGSSTFALKLLLEKDELPETEKQIKKDVNDIINKVAQKLGNTATVCKKHYLHPVILEAYHDNAIKRILEDEPDYHLKGDPLLLKEEKLFLRILEKVA